MLRCSRADILRRRVIAGALDGIGKMTALSTIYVALLDEGTSVWRPVEAQLLGENIYRIVSENADPDDEHWEFSTGSLVRCEVRRLSGGEAIVAVEISQKAV